MTNERIAFYGSFYEETYTAMGVFKNRDAGKEIQDALTLMGAQPPAHVLDWCGGWGRHAIPAAKLGYRMTVLDFSERYIERLKRDAATEGVEVEGIISDFRETSPSIQADFAVNLFTAGIGHGSMEDLSLTKQNDRAALTSLYGALKPGASFMIETLALSWLMRNWSDSNWRDSEDGTKRLLEKREFDFLTNSSITTWIFQDKASGVEESHTFPLHVYSPAELVELLGSVGFGEFRFYSTFDGQPFTRESKRIVLVCKKS